MMFEVGYSSALTSRQRKKKNNTRRKRKLQKRDEDEGGARGEKRAGARKKTKILFALFRGADNARISITKTFNLVP